MSITEERACLYYEILSLFINLHVPSISLVITPFPSISSIEKALSMSSGVSGSLTLLTIISKNS